MGFLSEYQGSQAKERQKDSVALTKGQPSEASPPEFHRALEPLSFHPALILGHGLPRHFTTPCCVGFFSPGPYPIDVSADRLWCKSMGLVGRQGSRVRVYGFLGLRVEGFGFRVVLGFRVSGLGIVQPYWGRCVWRVLVP